MSSLVRWMRWELSRRIDMTVGVRLIILDRSVKAVALVIGGILLIIATRSGFLHDLTLTVQRELNLANGRGLWLRLVSFVLDRFGSLSRRTEYEVGIAAILYGVLEAFEALGLVLRRRWGEYLVLLATVAFIPLEVDEIVRSITVLKTLALLINVAILVYLIYRKRLFLEHPDTSGPHPA